MFKYSLEIVVIRESTFATDVGFRIIQPFVRTGNDYEVVCGLVTLIVEVEKTGEQLFTALYGCFQVCIFGSPTTTLVEVFPTDVRGLEAFDVIETVGHEVVTVVMYFYFAAVLIIGSFENDTARICE
jgi:hypothetical protein